MAVVDIRGVNMLSKSSKIGVAFLSMALCAFAQSDRGTITGTVTDPGGASVPKVEFVTAHPLQGS